MPLDCRRLLRSRRPQRRQPLGHGERRNRTLESGRVAGTVYLLRTREGGCPCAPPGARVEIRGEAVWMTGGRARAGGSCNEFREEHRGTNENPGAAGGRDFATGPLCSRRHRSGFAAATLRAEFGSCVAQAPPATRAKRRSEANAGDSRHASRRQRKIIRGPARGRVGFRGGRSPQLARREEEARHRARSQAGDVRLAWGGRGRRCCGSGKAPPWLALAPAGGRFGRHVRVGDGVDGDSAREPG